MSKCQAFQSLERRFKAVKAANAELAQVIETYEALLKEHAIEWELDSGKWDEAEWHEKVLQALGGIEPQH